MPSASSRNPSDTNGSASAPSQTAAPSPAAEAEARWFGETAWVAGLRGGLKGAIQERHARDFVHALTVRPPFSVRWPKVVRRKGEFPLVALARQGVEVLDDSGAARGEEFLTELRTALELPQQDRRPRVREQVEAWSERLASQVELQPADLLASLAALVSAGHLLPTRCFLPLWRSTADACREFSEEFSAGAVDSVRAFLLHVELPCWIANVFWPIANLSERDAGLDAQVAGALAMLQGSDGSIHARFVPELGQWIGTLLRCVVLDGSRETPRISVQTRGRISDLLIRATALLGPCGEFPWSEPDAETLPLLAAAARVCGFSRGTATRQRLKELAETTAGEASRGGLKPTSRKRLRKLRSFQSDWGKTASLASDQAGSTARAVVRHHEPNPELLVEIEGVPLLRGPWTTALSIDGKRLSETLQWECSCWYSEPDADFVELSATVRPDCVVIRQVLVAKKQGWILLADEVQAPEHAIEYASVLPLASGWEAFEDAATREFALLPELGSEAKEPRVRVCPLDLPQDKVHPASGGFQCEPGEIRLARQARGGLYAATLLEWHRDNVEEGVDWNALTVAEDGRVMTSDEAVGYRIRIGERHLAFYHSLTRARIGRSVLGLHTLSETVAATFTPEGILKALVEVEFGNPDK